MDAEDEVTEGETMTTPNEYPQPGQGPGPQPGPGAGAYQPPERRRAPAWVIVAATLGAVLLAGGIFVAGVVVGVAASKAGTSTAGSGGSGGATTDGSTGGSTTGSTTGSTGGGATGGDSSFDPCLVGSWRSVAHEETIEVKDQGPVTISSVTRTVTFDAGGRETVRYDRSTADVTVKDGKAAVVFDGTVSYRASTKDGQMSFELLDADGTITVTMQDGTEEQQPLKPGTGSVSYTCDATRFVQTASGFRSEYERQG